MACVSPSPPETVLEMTKEKNKNKILALTGNYDVLDSIVLPVIFNR